VKRVLITGASGFIGAYLTRYLLNKGHDLHLLVRPGYKEWRIKDILSHVRLHCCSLNNPADIESAVQQIRPEWVFHLAAHGAYSSQTVFSEMLRTNLVGLANLVSACLKTDFEAFINAGSSSEYGIKDYAPLETDCIEPNSNYAITKASATLYCCFIAKSRNVNIKTLRLYSVFGPYEEPSRLLPRLIIYGMHGKYPPLVNPEIGRDFVFVEDACRAFELSAQSESQERGTVYNVGTGSQSTIGAIVQIVREILHITEEPRWGSMPVRDWDTNTWVANPRKIMGELNWQPRYTLKQGISEMIDWFKRNPMLQSYYETMTSVLPK
jgi:nucleoside-diphosphate-sugar epimerase